MSFDTLVDAVAFVDAFTPAMRMVGKSLSADPLVSGWQPMTAVSRHAVLQLRRMVDEQQLRHDGDPALTDQVAATMVSMGVDGPRTYFMGFQTNAEVRGTGGLLGGYGILRFDNGVPTVDALAPNTDLTGAVAPVDLGPEYDQQYGFQNPFFDYRNSNISPHFPYAAQIWQGMWLEQTGMQVDGVIAIDPVALSYILGAVGPVTMPDGEIVPELLSSYEVAEGGAGYIVTFTLREGLKWSDGEPVTTEDVDFAYNYVNQYEGLGDWGCAWANALSFTVTPHTKRYSTGRVPVARLATRACTTGYSGV